MTQAAAIATAGGRRSRRPSHSSCSARGKYRSPRPPRLRRRARIEPVRTMRIPTPTWSRTRTRACCRPCSPRRRSGGARRRRRSTVRRSGCPLALACVADRFFLNPCCRAAIQMCARGTRIARSCYRCARTRVSICPARPSSARLRRSWNASTSSRREIGRRSARRGAECSYVWSFSWILRLTSSEFPNNLCMRSSLLLDSAIDFRISTVSSIVRAASVYLSR